MHATSASRSTQPIWATRDTYDPTHNDEALLTAAFTLARLDASLAEGSYREWMEQVHGRLWQRILQSAAMR